MADETQTEEATVATDSALSRARLKTTYEDEIRPKLQEEFGYRSSMQHPRLEKITLSMGVGEAKTNSKALDEALEQMAIIAGQRPSVTRARKSIAQFKLREGMAIGCKVTLRGNRMWEFLDRLTSVALPRIRDFRGINPDGFDGRGNYNLGLREQTIFPEIDYDNVDAVRGLNVTITTTAVTDEEGRALLRHLGMPFRAEGYSAEERAARRRRKQKKFGRGRR
jgi:large subunit ribosomal protein L5